MKGLRTLAAMSLVIAGGAVALVASGAASAASSADLSIGQRFSGGSVSGTTVDTVRIHNAGPSTAANVNLVMLVKANISSLGIASAGGGVCELEPAPPGYTIAMATCQLPAIASGSTELDKITWSGKAGVKFTSTVTVGSSTSDPRLANNLGTASSWFGPRAELRLTQSATSGPTAGRARIVSTVVNRGPNNANALQLVMEVNSAGYQSVHATTNISGASCQFIPPATGYNRAVNCTTGSLATGAKWVVTFAFTGHAGSSLVVKNKVTANNPVDPVPSDNSASSSTKYHA
jgi:hypothetical protein